MNPQTEMVLLVDGEEAVIHDVQFSLGLLGIKLNVARTVTEAEKILAAEVPTIVIVRESLAEATALHKTLARLLLPTVILFPSSSDESDNDGTIGPHVVDRLFLPIEFPSFSHQMRTLVSRSPLLKKDIRKRAQA